MLNSGLNSGHSPANKCNEVSSAIGANLDVRLNKIECLFIGIHHGIRITGRSFSESLKPGLQIIFFYEFSKSSGQENVGN